MTNQAHTITYGGQHPIPRTSKFMSVYHIYAPFQGNVHAIIQKRKLLVSYITKSAVTMLKGGYTLVMLPRTVTP
jgi:hypothetical protein